MASVWVHLYLPKKQHKIPTTKKFPCKIEQKLLLPNISLCSSFHLNRGKSCNLPKKNNVTSLNRAKTFGKTVGNRGGVFAVLPRAQDSLQHPYSEMQSEGTKNGDSCFEGEMWMERFVSCFGGNTAKPVRQLVFSWFPRRLTGAGVFTYTKFTPPFNYPVLVGKIYLRVLPKLWVEKLSHHCVF